MSDIEKASKLLNMSPQTLRLFMKEGRFGVAVKGIGKRFIYRVNWKEVKEWIENTNSSKQS